jgi:hypothetical protein
MATAGVNISLQQYVRVNVGLNPILLQAHRDAVRVVLSDARPVRSNPTFHLLHGEAPPLKFDSLDTNVWVLGTTDKATLVVSELTHVPVALQGEILDLDNGYVPVDVNKTDDDYSQLGLLHCKLDDLIAQLKIANMYHSIGHDIKITESDLEE